MKRDWKFVVVIILLFLSVVLMFASDSYKDLMRTKACQSMGYEEYDTYNWEDVCKDLEGNIHFVELTEQDFDGSFKISYMLSREFDIKEISVGDVRVVGGLK